MKREDLGGIGQSKEAESTIHILSIAEKCVGVCRMVVGPETGIGIDSRTDSFASIWQIRAINPQR